MPLLVCPTCFMLFIIISKDTETLEAITGPTHRNCCNMYILYDFLNFIFHSCGSVPIPYFTLLVLLKKKNEQN
jgi:hypothetical protein